MRWLELRWRVVDKRLKIFRSKYKNGKKYKIQKNDLHKGPIVSVNAVLIIPLKISLQSSRKVKNLYFFSKYSFFNFLQNDPMDTKNAVITTSPKSFWWKAENFSLKLQKW